MSAESCETESENSERQQKEEVVQVKLIESSLESEDLSDSAKRAFENKARQKLYEFADYYSMYSDTALADQFRQTALTLLKSLFVSNSAYFEINLDGVSDPQKAEPGTAIRVDSIELLSELTNTEGNSWESEMKFKYTHHRVIGNDSIQLVRSTGRCPFIVKKVEKRIGGRTSSVWQLYLKEIKA